MWHASIEIGSFSIDSFARYLARSVKYNTLASSSWVMYFLIEHKIIRTTIIYS